MCVYNIEIDEEVVSRVLPSFKDDSALKEWMQEQIVRLMKQYVVPASSGHKIEGRKAALDFIKSLAVPGGYHIPMDEPEIGCLVSEKYD